MKSRKPEQKKPSELRKRAEKKLASKKTAPKVMSDKETQQLIHELQVHQIELEMQNEELRTSQAELEESRAKYSDLYDFAPVGYFTFDRQGLILEANLTAAKDLGRERSLLMNKPFRSYIVTDDRNIFDSHLQKIIKSKKRQTCELRLKRKDGSEFYAKLEGLAANDVHGNPLCRTSVSDITESKKMEEQLLRVQQFESIGVLAGGIAHDFNNLLQAILGNVSLAKMYLPTHSPERVASLLERAEEALENAKELSYRLITFSKGGNPIRKLSSFEHILRTSMDLSLNGSHITSDILLPYDLYPVEIDEKQMTTVFSNILMNAKEAMPDGGSIKITAKNISISENDSMPLQEGDYVQISIKDSGAVIPETVLPKIFDPYFTTKKMRSQKGLGLGLPICLSIVRKHGGHISVDSKKGMGTTFHIFLPALRKVLHIQEPAMIQPQDVSRRLLFMDDDANIREVFKEMMSYLEYEAECAKDGEEAVELFRKAKESGRAFDAVILNLTVKDGMGGDETIERILKIDPEAKAVISSGYVDAPIVKNYQKYGFVDAIVKPYRMAQLKELLDNLNPHACSE
jgi:two-component system, cell cycle sensor histidine kinase and response regulator CckA